MVTFNRPTTACDSPPTIVPAPIVTADQRELVTRTIAKDATPQELELFLYDCARQGVHPLDRYCISPNAADAIRRSRRLT